MKTQKEDFVTPMTVTGMGDVSPLTTDPPVTAVIVPDGKTGKDGIKKYKMKSLRDYLIQKKAKKEVDDKDLDGTY